MKQIYARILKNERLCGDFYRITVASEYLSRKSSPGQFVEVRCSEGTDPLLRRPFGVHRKLKNGIQLLFEVVGRGTEVIAAKNAGDTLDIIGPLGNGFDIKKRTDIAILVAGGNGIAPIFGLAEEMKYRGSDVILLMGACSKSGVLCEKELRSIGVRVMISTEDGSKGCRGLVTKLLARTLAEFGTKRKTVYACGPTGMLRAVSKMAVDDGTSCQVSLEERMACGVGVCLGCPVKIKNGLGEDSFEYKMVCKDGPVFDAGEIAW